MPAHIKYPNLHNKNWLINALKTKTISQIARDEGCGESRVSQQVSHFRIKLPRTHGQAISLGVGGANKKKDQWGNPHKHNGYWKYYDWDQNGKRTEHAVHDLKYAQEELGHWLPENWVVHHKNGKNWTME